MMVKFLRKILQMTKFNVFCSTLFIGIIKFYKKAVSPWLPGACRYEPTCSEYMIEAIHQYGAWYGLILGFKRIGRCHPWGGSGYDPVPKQNKSQKNDTD